jgi:small subunit ribosomal protein S6e
MVFKINIATKQGKTFKLEIESENLVGMKIGDSIKGEEIDDNLKGYSLKITGLSDRSGFPALPDLNQEGLKKTLLYSGKAMRKTKPKGMRKKKTVAGNIITTKINQINTMIETQGEKKLEEIFPEQNKPKEKQPESDVSKTNEPENKPQENKEINKEEKPQEEKPQEEKPQESKETSKETKPQENKEEKKQEAENKESETKPEENKKE